MVFLSNYLQLALLERTRYLSRLLRGVEHGDVDRTTLVLRHRHGHTEEGVEGVALPLAPGAGERGAKLRLEHGVHEAVVAADVVRQSLRRHHLVRATEGVLQQKHREIEQWQDKTQLHSVSRQLSPHRRSSDG